ncbi:ATP-binding cassette domain-containing protein [Clostridium folliculivorans]|uniref:ABC transporter ATP-binding protein n=1 Tax=Clostridium folliculivorans TaxID=2886038 RepID=A0A9W5Y189_9CLOT|nr:ABC transporter ATP-binding protein [Clostridium folliculivorans]GKU24694.1 ABC transporter ATP-binding protein [Clostridium folliculivorans]GKU30792.1 ABC transporter ATP-binding protein [Clostridium folliculivorans]
MKLVLREIEKSFDKKKVLRNVSFVFEKGKIYGLLGRNGAGKTTLFNCISGDMQCDNGSVTLYDESDCEHELDYSNIGFVFSQPLLPEFLTGYEFLKFFIDININKISNLLTIDEYFNMIKIDEDDRYRLIKGYSHGMKNKIQMLCFLITRPQIILLDEPLTSFDVVVALQIKNLLKEIKTDHIIIFSTHILQIATDLCDEIVVLNNGVLEEVDNDILNSIDFEDRIMDILKEERDA